MEEFDIPIFRKAYDLCKSLYVHRNNVSRRDRYALWQRCENAAMDVLTRLLLASQTPKTGKLPILERASFELNFLRVFLRLCKEVKAIDAKKYVEWQAEIDEIGRMLGGWIRSIRGQ